MTHFLDETGNIPKQMPKEAREMASFLALIVDTSTRINPSKLPQLTSGALKKDVREQHGLKLCLRRRYTGCVPVVKMREGLAIGRVRNGTTERNYSSMLIALKSKKRPCHF